jgi:hypothetical protein
LGRSFFIDFVAWYRPTKAPTGINYRFFMPNGTFWQTRNRRSVVLFVPYIKLNVASEELAYSALLSYIPFRDERSKLIPEHYNGSTVGVLQELLNAPNGLLDHIRDRLNTRQNREDLREEVSAASAHAALHDLRSQRGPCYDLNDMGDDNDEADLMPSNEVDSMSAESTEMASARLELIIGDSPVFTTADRQLFARLSNSLALIKASFFKHQHPHRDAQDGVQPERNVFIRNPISTILDDVARLKSSFKQTRAYSLARYTFAECLRNPEHKRLRLRISGPAGTGKSTVLKCIIRLATEMFIPDANTGECGTIVVAAWSGIAAYNCGGSTLSGIFNTRSSSTQRITENLKGVKLVIMDEDSNNSEDNNNYLATTTTTL